MPVLILVLLVSSIASHYMDRFNVVIEIGMFRNVALTNSSETMDLVDFGLVSR